MSSLSVSLPNSKAVFLISVHEQWSYKTWFHAIKRSYPNTKAVNCKICHVRAMTRINWNEIKARMCKLFVFKLVQSNKCYRLKRDIIIITSLINKINTYNYGVVYFCLLLFASSQQTYILILWFFWRSSYYS